MVLNGRIKTGNVAGDLRAIPVTSESAGRRPKSGYLVDSRKGRKMAGVSGWGEGVDDTVPPRSGGTRHMHTQTEART